MATSDFLIVGNPIYKFSSFSQSTVAAFSTQFNTDWAAVLPSGGVQLLATTAQPLQAIFRVPNGGTLYINNGAARTPTDGAVTIGSPVVTSAAQAFFNQSDVGATITGTGIPGATTILSVQSPTQATMSANATATGSGLSIVVTRVGGDLIGWNAPFGWQVIPASQMSSFYVATTN